MAQQCFNVYSAAISTIHNRKKISLKTVQRLESILAEYEDVMWLLRLITTQGGGDVSRVPEPHTLRKALIERNMEDCMQICSDLFDAGEAYKFGFDNASDLADWCFHSKRIFSISEHLCKMLLATDLPDFTAEGIKFVSQAFIIKLEKPVKTSSGKEHDFILCSYCPNTGALSIRSYPKVYEDYKPIDETTKRLVEKDARNRNPRFDRFVDKITRQSRPRFAIGYTCFLSSTDSLKESILQAAPPEEKDDWEVIFQLALGVNLYLQSARDKDVEKITSIKTPKLVMGGKKPITEGASLFELSTSKAFTAGSHGKSESDNDSDEAPKGTVRPHFRKGYWRRPSGFGDDPKAFATIWVRPTWVRKDKIEAGEKPIGSFQDVPEE